MGLIESLRNYPPGVFFMLGNEFCERFSFYGMRAILTLYLIIEHHFSESQASLFYHAFVSLAYLSPLLGSIAADNYFGRFRVIFYVSIIYVIGHCFLSFGAVPDMGSGIKSSFDFTGLIIIALATGGIKPCVSAFAADQFGDEQKQERSQFFSFFYFAINAGSLVAILITPMLRGRVKCFGSDYCFPLAFGVPAVLMLVAFLLFLAGKRYYKISPPAKGNYVFRVIACISYAFGQKMMALFSGEEVNHWLDYATPKYNEELVSGVRSLVSISVLFGPIILFWALFDQQGSTWVLQARRLDGRVGPLTILPDQMNTFNPLVVLIMVPIFEAFIYPAVRRITKVTPLRKMAVGGLLAATAFLMAGVLQLKVNDTMEPRPEVGHVFLQRLGNSSQSYQINNTDLNSGKMDLLTGSYTVQSDDGAAVNVNLTHDTSGYVLGLFDTYREGINFALFEYNCEKMENGRTRLYLLISNGSSLRGGEFYVIDHEDNIHARTTIASGVHVDIQPALISSPDYLLKFGSPNCTVNTCEYSRKFHAQMGATHVVSLMDSGMHIDTIVRPNTINMLWQLPQFFVITIAEILFSITGLEFSYSQASPNMKSVLQALWLTTVFLGNVLDMFISGFHVFSDPAVEFFAYALITLAVLVIFVILAIRYKYVEDNTNIETKVVRDQAIPSLTEKITDG